jgi:hypothetical protein
MLFKIIDPNFVLGDTYRNWPIETKVTYTVICALANYKTGEFYHSTLTIAYHANLCRRAVQRSLKRMADANIVAFVEPDAHSGKCNGNLWGLVFQIMEKTNMEKSLGWSPFAEKKKSYESNFSC